MLKSRKTQKKLAMTITAILAGGSVFGACETRLRTALVDGSKDFIFSLFNPQLFLDTNSNLFNLSGS